MFQIENETVEVEIIRRMLICLILEYRVGVEYIELFKAKRT